MIKNISDFLEKLRDAERKSFDSKNIKHRTTIGNAYEGITQTLLKKAIFDDLNINIITNSFIEKQNGEQSAEFDIIIIEGTGEYIPYTKEQYLVKFNQVIAVLQVKKRLNKAQLDESFHNLRNVYDVAEFDSFPTHSKRLFRDSYRQICNEDIIENGVLRTKFSDTTKEQIFHILKLESLMPARIIFAYEGFKTEYGMRESFIKMLSEYKSTSTEVKYGYGPLNFPDLILNGEFSFVKGNAMPYVSPLINGQWPFFLSSSEAPIIKLLEIIWTRLTYRYDINTDIFGEDLELEGLNMFLLGNIVNVSGIQGWQFESPKITKKTLTENTGNIGWEPVLLNSHQHDIISFLCYNGSIKLSSLKNDDFENESAFNSFIDELCDTKLVTKENGFLKLLTDQCQCVYIPNKGFYAADNKSGKLTRWIQKKLSQGR